MTDIEARFWELARQWHDETGMHSSPRIRKQHLAYAEIVAMGWDAVPLLIRALREFPDMWFYMLREITNVNPLLPEERGFFDIMVIRWETWYESLS